MGRFIVRRFFTSLLSLVAVTMLIFAISRIYGDPIANFIPEEGFVAQEVLDKIAAEHHLDDPWPVQYIFWIKDLLTGNLGRDLHDRRPLWPKLKQRFTPTLKLAGAGWVLATIVGVPLGILSAVKRGSVWDFIGRMFAVSGVSLPTFWVALVAILVFAVWLGWLPVATMGEGAFPIKSFILPTAIISWGPMAGYVRLTRSAMLEVLDSEFIKLAGAKGVSERAVIWKHGFKNVIIAPLTYGGDVGGGLVQWLASRGDRVCLAGNFQVCRRIGMAK